LQEGQATAATELYGEAIQLDPFFDAAYLDIARVYAILKDRKRALDALDKVLKQDPGNDAARMERYRIATAPEENK